MIILTITQGQENFIAKSKNDSNVFPKHWSSKHVYY